jgi:pimeloyl-ACP methyl ester carboxylesterase
MNSWRNFLEIRQGEVAYTLAAIAPERVGADRSPRAPLPAAGGLLRPVVRAGARLLVPVACVPRGGGPRRRRRPGRVRAHPVGHLEPPGWFDHDEFEKTARSFANPDWVAITLQAYRSRFLKGEVHDARYEPMARRLAEVEKMATPTLMIQGGADRCDEPAASAGQERFFVGGYRRVVLEGVGYFPHREAPRAVAAVVDEHLRSADR